MKRLSIELNNVIRDYTEQVSRYYQKEFDHDFDRDNLVYTADNELGCFPFESPEQKREFLTINYPNEIYGYSNAIDQSVFAGLFNTWLNNLTDYDGEQPQIGYIACGESHLQIQATYYFLHKTAARVRKVTFPTSSDEALNDCDVLITANPILLNRIKDFKDKVFIKINTPYNQSCEAHYSYDSLLEFINDEDTVLKVLELEK